MKGTRKRPTQNQRGQASIMIGMMMTTFILFFAFVVNTGMLVNAKINLQNAADLAAYAGAAVQARQLTQISYLNYEMRRQYKKFLFRYYVMGNMAQRPFPRNSSGGSGKTPPNWSPDGSTPYGVPMVCMIFNSRDNFCQLPSLPQISIPGRNPLDAINDTLVDQLQQIERIRQQNCINIGITNTMALRLWLWNTDPALERLQNNTLDPNVQRAINTIRGITYGLGLVPRELILRQRISTLSDYVNQTPGHGVTFDQVNGMKNGIDPAANERTIEAFLSAFYTLGEHTFPADRVQMDELMSPELLRLNDIKAQFDTYAINFKINGGTTADGTRPGDCQPFVEADILKSGIPLGVYKEPSIMTYYAVRLKAKARVMFSPFGDMDLSAYAAAQPFGSRIGPPLEETDFVREGRSRIADSSGFTIRFNNKIPNLAIRAQDTATPNNGWDTQEALGAFYSQFRAPGTGGNLPTVDSDALKRAYQAAMVPNPYERNKYNIINDVGPDAFVRNFDSRQQAAFWAPVFSPSQAASGADRLKSMVDNLIGDTGADSARFKAAIQAELSSYFDKLRQGQGEDGEGFNIVRLQDPFHHLDNGPIISLDNSLAMTDPTQFKTSWNDVLNESFRAQGRVGYSVKFVSFNSLTQQKTQTNGSSTWSNDLSRVDDEAARDFPLLRH